MIKPQHTVNQLSELALRANRTGNRLATAESCTGGLVAALCTSVVGSSNWFECSVVAYSPDAKHQLLGVRLDTMKRYGVVSEPVVSEMARGILLRSNASLSVAVSGIAGPEGGRPELPVGTVWLAWARRNGEAEVELLQTSLQRYRGQREEIQTSAAEAALSGFIHALS